jgi:uncharacterized protein (TIGR03067 family)
MYELVPVAPVGEIHSMRHRFRISASLLLLGTFVAHAEERNAATTTKPVSELLGRWRVISISGKPLPPDLTPIWIVDDKHITVTDRAGQEISRSPYIIDRSKEPTQLVMKVDGEKDRIGWYRFKDGKLEILLTVNTGEPPKSWEGGSVMVLSPAHAQ